MRKMNFLSWSTCSKNMGYKLDNFFGGYPIFLSRPKSGITLGIIEQQVATILMQACVYVLFLYVLSCYYINTCDYIQRGLHYKPPSIATNLRYNIQYFTSEYSFQFQLITRLIRNLGFDLGKILSTTLFSSFVCASDTI